MVELIKAIILGVVEGFTEFLPISSTGHLIIVAALLGGLNDRLDNLFEIFIQIGAVLAVIFYYRADLIQQARTFHFEYAVRHLWLSVVIAFIPAALIGFLFQGIIDPDLFAPGVVGLTLIAGGLVFLLVENRPQTDSPQTTTLEDIRFRQAALIGLMQVFALIPGISRSGASIIGGMLVGLHREVATKFSFYLAIPTLGVATVYKLWVELSHLSASDVLTLAAGTVVSAVVAWLSIDWLLRYIATNTFIPFGYYRILVGIPVLILSLLGILN